jgi:hypothetical protein
MSILVVIKYIVLQLLFAFIVVLMAPFYGLYSMGVHAKRSFEIGLASGLLTNFAGGLTWLLLGIVVVPLCGIKNTLVFLWCGPSILEEAIDDALRPLE